ncbi:solute carrier family 46 member 3-like isoform X2 [Homarus americanus]|nr:solute carrier family 46 member 3-like isoform X2 [Homarus americanus]XP_042208943.1 solute carrier family 46 member 3-like isoform X2 [Homarus americanus]
MVQSSLGTNLLLFKVCREQHNEPAICANLSSYPDKQASVQQVVTIINMYSSLMTNIPAVFFVLFLGSWSDIHGRKIPMIVPLVGNCLATMLYLVNALWIELPSMYILLTAVPQALTGGFITLLMAAYSYMADITKFRARTMRIAFLDLGFGLASPIGLLLSDYLFYRLGYAGVYGFSGLFFLFGIIYTIIRIEDTRGPFSKYQPETCELTHRPGNRFRDIFNTKNVKETFAVVMKSRPDRGRAKILLLMTAMCLLLFSFGSSNFSYLYVKWKFGWDYNQYVHLNLVETLVSLVAMTVILPLLSYRLQVEDSLLALLGCVSKICSLIIQGIALYPWYLYLSSVVACVGGLPLIITRSFISKSVPQRELGKVFSILASWESILPLLSHPLYTLVYNATVRSFPGTMYFMTAIFLTVAALIYIWLFFNRTSTSATPHIHEDNISEIES